MSTSLLVIASAAVATLHSVLPDHWLPLALVARSNRWSVGRTVRVSLFVAGGHVAVSLLLGLAVAAVGLALRTQLVAQEGHIVGGVLLFTGAVLLVWALRAQQRPHRHPRPTALRTCALAARRRSPPEAKPRRLRAAGDIRRGRSGAGGSAAQERRPALRELVVPFGVAASPDLTILPVLLAASAVSPFTAVLVLLVFAAATLLTFAVLTAAATVGGYQFEWPWLEQNGHLLTAVLLLGIGAFAYLRI